MKSDNAIRNGTSIFMGIIVAIAAFVRGALLLPLLLVACSVWGLYVLQHLRGSLTAVPKKKAKAPRRAKFVVPDIENEPLSDILLLNVNQRITAALRTTGSNITWEWATKDPLAIVKEGGRCLIRVHGLDGFESAEVVLDKQAHLRCELINTVPLRPNPATNAPEKPRIPAETPPFWFGSPISLPMVEWVTAAALGSVLSVAFCTVFTKAQLLPTAKRSLAFPFRHKTHATSVTREEGRKLLLMNGAAVFLAISTRQYIIIISHFLRRSVISFPLFRLKSKRTMILCSSTPHSANPIHTIISCCLILNVR